MLSSLQAWDLTSWIKDIIYSSSICLLVSKMSFWGLLSHSPGVCPSVLPSYCFYLDPSPQAMIFRWLLGHHISSPSPFLLPLPPYCRGTGTSAPALQSLFPVISSRLMVFNNMSLLVTPKFTSLGMASSCLSRY